MKRILIYSLLLILVAGVAFAQNPSYIGTETILNRIFNSSSDALNVTVVGGSSGAPTDADYWTGSAQAGLSAEIVVNDSAGLAGALDDETGTLLSVFSDSPVFTTQITTPLIVAPTDNVTLTPAASGDEIILDGIPVKSISAVDVDGVDNIFIGTGAGDANTTADDCIFIGNGSGGANTTGQSNTFIGTNAGTSNTEGTGNFFLGNGAGEDNVLGDQNFFLGNSAGGQINGSTANDNIAIGAFAMSNSTSTVRNVVIGTQAGQNISGNTNVYIGGFTGGSATGADNTMIGDAAGSDQTSPTGNTLIGKEAAQKNRTGSGLVVMGFQAGKGVSANSHSNNTIIGYESGLAVTTGSNNTFLGYQAGNDITTGAGNVAIGYQAGNNASLDDEDNTLWIANSNTTTPLIGGNFSTPAVVITGTLHVTGNITSDAACCGADYVFDESYKLMDLESLDDFIAKNKHLPEIEFTPEININNRLTLLLQKIEELTLYTIEQEQRIKELEKPKGEL